ncbi:MAG: patatin-like phospholipase family protein [Gammaproteobacteria bacterium]|nr:patatin-like phospholipase family protein [Gammaproteobacteria bacterium]
MVDPAADGDSGDATPLRVEARARDSAGDGASAFGLVLSGGAACGLANIGVLEVLDEAGLRPHCIAGSSMGAIIGALYAMGHAPATLRRLARALTPQGVARLSERPLHGGLHGGLLRQEMEAQLAPLLGDARIADCRIPFVCVAGRVRSPIQWHRLMRPSFVAHLRECVERHVFAPCTRLYDAVRASSAIPVVFSPVRIDADEFIDLVHFGPIPARSLREVHAPRWVVATDTQPRYDSLEPWMPAPLREFLAAGREETARSLAACDMVIRPELPGSALRFDLGETFADAGRAAAIASLPALYALLRGDNRDNGDPRAASHDTNPEA